MVKRILITGAAGFIGSHFVEDVLKNTDWEVVALVRMDKIGDGQRLIEQNVTPEMMDRVKVVWHDLRSPINPSVDARIGHIDYVCHLAANSDVNRSIVEPVPFFYDNVIGTVNLLEWARLRNKIELRLTKVDHDVKFTGVEGDFVAVRDYGNIEMFLNFSTDEVFGPAPEGVDWTEEARWRPSNAYSSSKAGAAAAGYSYWVTYKLPVITTHMMNTFGEKQNSEKLVPKAIKYILNGQAIPLHCKLLPGVDPNDQSYVSPEIGQRHWLHARNAANATLFILQNGKAGEFYNIVGDEELDNKQVVDLVGEILDIKPTYKWVDFSQGRPGHDRRYSLDGNKLKQMGWVPPVSFKDSFRNTVLWYQSHPEWLK